MARDGESASFETPPRPPRATVPLLIERRAERRHVERTGRNRAHPPHHRVAANMVHPIARISPPDSVERRATSWPGMAAEIVQATGCDRLEFRFCAPVHLLAVYERGMRHEGETFAEGLPGSTLRDFGRKLVFVPAGHVYRDWQEPRIPTRVAYFYFDPATLAINADLSVTELPFRPRLFFEDNGLLDLTLKLTTLIEGGGPVHRLVEALCVLMAHELIRLHIGQPDPKPEVRGGLAAWQERAVAAYIEDNLAEPISLGTLAELARLSPYHFCRAFKNSCGVPPHRFHTSRRIERAKALLEKPAHSVTDIGLTVGFGEASSFTAAFRRATGLTPSSYRRSSELLERNEDGCVLKENADRLVQSSENGERVREAGHARSSVGDCQQFGIDARAKATWRHFVFRSVRREDPGTA
jgi:AraC family transcriptional regulator